MALLFIPVQTNRQRRIIPVNVPVNDPADVSKQSVNVPEAVPDDPKLPPAVAVQFSNIPDATKNPKLNSPAEHLRNVPLAIAFALLDPPNEESPQTQSSNNPDAFPPPPPKDPNPPIHLR